MKSGKKGLGISFNSPAVLAFVGICLLERILSEITGGNSTDTFFCVYRSSLLNPMTWIRCVTHIFGHADWNHFIGNMMYILILGPMLEEKHGTKNIILVVLATALITGIADMLFFPKYRFLGASGVVFAFILLSSITVTEEGKIPLTFILVALLYIGQQIYEGITVKDQVSQITHIIGGGTGSVLGFILSHQKSKGTSGTVIRF